MKQHRFASIGLVFALVAMNSTLLVAQTNDPVNDVIFGERNLGGPRLGVTYVAGSGKLSETLAKNQIGRTLEPVWMAF